jgi:CheY-like chemotaxis protein
VVEASNGAEALRVAHDERLHAICLDLTMPEQDGFDVIRKLKDDATTPRHPGDSS